MKRVGQTCAVILAVAAVMGISVLRTVVGMSELNAFGQLTIPSLSQTAQLEQQYARELIMAERYYTTHWVVSTTPADPRQNIEANCVGTVQDGWPIMNVRLAKQGNECLITIDQLQHHALLMPQIDGQPALDLEHWVSPAGAPSLRVSYPLGYQLQVHVFLYSPQANALPRPLPSWANPGKGCSDCSISHRLQGTPV